MTEVSLPAEWVRDKLPRLARERLERSRDWSPRYGHNTVEGNIVGLKGEAAVLVWADASGFTINAFEGFEMPDVCLGRPGPPWLRIEVKTWQPHNWIRLGLQVSATQFEKVALGNQVVVWATADAETDESSNVVTIRGWTPTEDLVKHGEPRWTGGLHANVRVPAEWVAPMDVLAARGPGEHSFPSMSPTPPPCGHRHVLGKCWRCAPQPLGPPIPSAVRIDQGYFHLPKAVHGFDDTTEPSLMSPFDAATKFASCRHCFPLQQR